MKSCTQEAAQAKLLPRGQPPVQPAGEAIVLGAPPQLEESGTQPGKVNQCQHHQGNGGKGDVHHLNGHFVEKALLFHDVRLYDVPEEVVQVEDDEEGQGADYRDAPGGKEVEWDVFNFQRRGEETHINRDEAHPVTDLLHCILSLLTVAAQENLKKRRSRSRWRTLQKPFLFLHPTFSKL